MKKREHISLQIGVESSYFGTLFIVRFFFLHFFVVALISVWIKGKLPPPEGLARPQVTYEDCQVQMLAVSTALYVPLYQFLPSQRSQPSGENISVKEDSPRRDYCPASV